MGLKIIFMGTPDICLPTLKALINSEHDLKLVVTREDKPKGRGKKLAPPPVKKVALESGVQVFQPRDLKEEMVYNKLKEQTPDLIVSMAYGEKIPEKILEIPTHGSINIHPSLLPKYRGAAPIHWAVINGDKETGITIISMDKSMDTGDILAQKKIPINFGDTTGDIYNRVRELSPSMLLETLSDITSGNIEVKKQSNSQATTAPKLTKKHLKINWQEEDSLKVYNKIRGLNPWPGAFTFWKDKRIKLWFSEIVSREDKLAKPGEVVKLEDKGPIVQCEKGLICLTSLQPEGKKALEGTDFLKGYSLKVGEHLEGGE